MSASENTSSQEEDIGMSENTSAQEEGIGMSAGAQVSPLDDPSLLMPSLCRHFALRGTCRFKDECHYSHVLPSDCKDWNEACQRIPCPHYQRGICRYASMCRLAHCVVINEGAAATKKSPVVSKGKSTEHDAKKSPVVSKGRSTEHDVSDESAALSNAEVHAFGNLSIKSDDFDPNELCCGICMDPLGQVRNDDQGEIKHNRKKFGLLSACDHIFCITCLRTWRYEQKKRALNNGRNMFSDESSGDASNRVRACPACRQASDFVVPSDRFCTGEEKRQVVASYQARLSCTPCKRFNGKLGSCPFGKDCFYAHCDPHTGQDKKSLDKTKNQLWTEKQERKRAKEQRRRSQQRRSSLFEGLTSVEMDALHELLYLSSMERFFDTLEGENSDDDDSSVNSGDMANAYVQSVMGARNADFFNHMRHFRPPGPSSGNS